MGEEATKKNQQLVYFGKALFSHCISDVNVLFLVIAFLLHLEYHLK